MSVLGGLQARGLLGSRRFDVLLFDGSCEEFALSGERQPRRKHPPLGIVVVLDVVVGDLVDRMIQRPFPGDESFVAIAHGSQAEEPVINQGANDLQGFVLYLRRRCRRIAMSDMPIHRIEIQRPTQAVQQQHQEKIKLQKEKVKVAELRVERAQKGYHVYVTNLRENLKRRKQQLRGRTGRADASSEAQDDSGQDEAKDSGRATIRSDRE